MNPTCHTYIIVKIWSNNQAWYFKKNNLKQLWELIYLKGEGVARTVHM
jgi:hypothetical protein